MIQGRDFIIASSIEWNFLWQGPQEIASRLARAGNRVLYIENTGVRSLRLSDATRVVARLRNWTTALTRQGIRLVAPNLYICSPLVLPPFGSQLQQEVNRKLFLPLIVNAVGRLKMRNVIIWSFLPTDTVVDLIRLLKPRLSATIYYCVADFGELSTQPSRIKESEKELLGLSDLVLAQCAPLASHCSQWANKVHVVPYGVNLEVFSNSTQLGAETRAMAHRRDNGHDRNLMSKLPRPVIGYVGGLHRHLDLELLASMATIRPDWSWVCVGPAQLRVSSLSHIPNIHLTGNRPHEELAGLIEQFDVGIVPYVSSLYTDTVVPTKINEYLAMGTPVVSTDIPSVCEFNDRHRVLTTTVAQPESFVRAIENALQTKDESAREQRRSVAALSDWQNRLDAICDLIGTVPKVH